MLKRITFTLTVTAAFTGLYWLYALIVTSRLVPAALAQAQSQQLDSTDMQADPPPRNMEDAERYLPDAPWAVRAKFQIRLANGILYAQSWKPIDEEQDIFEFKPFAMISFNAKEEDNTGDAPNEGKKPPMTLIADAGLIRFSRKFDPVSQKIGRVIGGKLEGSVFGTGPDGLTVKGRDLFFVEKTLELYSDRPVEFTYQRHHGTAERGLKVELLPSNEPPKPDQILSVGGFRRVMLHGHVEMDLATDDGALHVVSEEGFDFNQETLTASLKVNVNVTRPTGPDEVDTLRCQYLDLFFDNGNEHDNAQGASRLRGDAPSAMPLMRSNEQVADSQTNSSANQDDKSDRGAKRLALRQLRASGNRVELESKRSGLTAFMTNLVYDVATKTAVLRAAAQKATSENMTSVIVQQTSQGNEMSCPEITLVQADDGQIESVVGKGAGWLKRRTPNADTNEFEARWKTQFVMQQVPNSNLNVLELHGKAVAKQPTRDTGLAADLIQLWFDRPAGNALAQTESPRPTSSRGKSISPTMSANQAATKSVPEPMGQNFRPRKLTAQNNVRVVSPQMSGQGKRLIVDFDEQPPRSAALASKTGSKRRVQPAGGRVVARDSDQVVNLFDREKPIEPRRKEKEVVAPPADNSEPLELMADLIHAKIRWDGDQADQQNAATELTEVWTEGNVDIQQPHGNGQEPLHLTGQRLHLQNVGDNGQILHVIGQPAVIRDRGFDIEGNNIFLDRAKNRTWINGPGALRLPVKNDFDGQKLATPALLTVWWQEKMEFDGLTATFVDDVKAVLNDSRLQCEEMTVLLAQRYSFSGDQKNAPQAEVRRIVCQDNVAIDQSQYIDKELIEIRRARMATLTLDQTTHLTDGVGPGEVVLWRPGRGKRAALAPRAVAQANRPLESDVTDWELTHVTFSGAMNGNLSDRQMTFHDRVRIVYGPVAHPLDTIDPDSSLPKDGGVMECAKLEIVQHQGAGSQKAYVELRADGDVKLEGRAFYAQADSISFDESKELYTLRSKGSRQVTIWRQTTPGGNYDEASAKSMRFIPSRSYLETDKTTGIRGAN